MISNWKYETKLLALLNQFFVVTGAPSKSDYTQFALYKCVDIEFEVMLLCEITAT